MEDKKNTSTTETKQAAAKPADEKNYTVQIEMKGSEENAKDFALKVKKAGFPVTQTPGAKGHTIQIGGLMNKQHAEAYITKVKESGFKASLIGE